MPKQKTSSPLNQLLTRARKWDKGDIRDLHATLLQIELLTGTNGIRKYISPQDIPSFPAPRGVDLESLWGVDKKGAAICRTKRGDWLMMARGSTLGSGYSTFRDSVRGEELSERFSISCSPKMKAAVDEAMHLDRQRNQSDWIRDLIEKELRRRKLLD